MVYVAGRLGPRQLLRRKYAYAKVGMVKKSPGRTDRKSRRRQKRGSYMYICQIVREDIQVLMAEKKLIL
jgi:hypothetical protein